MPRGQRPFPIWSVVSEEGFESTTRGKWKRYGKDTLGLMCHEKIGCHTLAKFIMKM